LARRPIHGRERVPTYAVKPSVCAWGRGLWGGTGESGNGAPIAKPFALIRSVLLVEFATLEHAGKGKGKRIASRSTQYADR
jgi:hypothetical protein